MRKLMFLIAALALLIPAGCRAYYKGGVYEYPTYPGGGNYGGDYDYGGYYPPTGDDEPTWSSDVLGEWEGFLWEDYRSDNLPLSKKTVAMRCSYSDTTHKSSGTHEWVKVNVLVDGRPTASCTAEAWKGGYLGFSSHQGDIYFDFDGTFTGNSARGYIGLEWDEKVEIPHTGKVEKHHVYLEGPFELGRVRGTHWAAAWDLFDRYGDQVWDLPEESWELATAEGLAHLAALEESALRDSTGN